MASTVDNRDYNAGKILKSSTGWLEDGNGTDDYGFTILPTSFWNFEGLEGGAGLEADFWTSTEVDEEEAEKMYLTHHDDYWVIFNHDKDEYYSVRCVMD